MDPQQGPPQPDLLIGQTIGNYLVTQKLGEGGMGAVYLAEHPTIGKKVALKVLHSEFSSNPEVAERFFTEAKAVNSIAHPNIVDIVDYGVLQTGARADEPLVYFIMEYLQGLTLSQTIRSESPLPPERALSIALQVADALAASHKCSIVHRNLKPDNIILTTRGRERDFVKLLDFGIAKLTSDARGSSRTRTGLVLGTPAYMSPEQCEGSAKVDHRTDIYALGICLYEMLVGRVPFIGEGYGEILVQHLTQRPIELSRYRMMSPHIEAVVMKALEKRPEMRFPTMDEFIHAMSDPVGYVESHGGVGGFAARVLTPSNVPTSASMPTRYGGAPLTPLPGMQLHSPVPGTLGGITPSPTTLSAASGQVSSGRSKAGFVIAGVVVVGAAAVGVFLVLNSGKKTDAGAGSDTAITAGSGTAQVSRGSASVGSAGSAAVAIVHDTGSGSAAGSGSATSVVHNAGSAVALPDPMSNLQLSSTPEGAEIFVDGVDINKTTYAVIQLARSKKSTTITLKLKGYDDVVLKDIALDGDEIAKTATLKKAHGSGAGHGSGHGTGKGSGGTKQCDTCLERPD